MDTNKFIKNKINILSVIWMFFLVELLIILGVFYFLLIPKELVQSKNIVFIAFLYISYIFAIVVIPVISKVYSIFKNKANKTEKLEEKFNFYQLAFIIKIVFFEISAILLLLAFYLNQIYSPLYLFGVIIIAFLFNKPSLSNFNKDFNVRDKNAIEPMNDERITSKNKY